MAEAEVGDDGFGEDPTVNRLEEAFAERVGKAAAVFVPSGVMANQIALRVLAQPGTAVVAGRHQHVVAYELGAAAKNAGIQFHAVDDADGTFGPADVSRRPGRPPTTTSRSSRWSAWRTPTWPRAVARGRWPTWRRCGRRPPACPCTWTGPASSTPRWPPGCRAADAGGHRHHGDAAACPRGSCAPVGSLLAGPADVVAEGRVERKRLGGAMRQAGVLAAAGLIALRVHGGPAGRGPRPGPAAGRGGGRAVARRRRSTRAPCRPTWSSSSPRPPRRCSSTCARRGCWPRRSAPGVVRFVTHRDVDDDGVERARARPAVRAVTAVGATAREGPHRRRYRRGRGSTGRRCRRWPTAWSSSASTRSGCPRC